MDIFRVIILSTTVNSLAPKDLHLSHMQNTSILFQVLQISSSKSAKLGMDETLAIIHCRVKFLTTYSPVNLENNPLGLQLHHLNHLPFFVKSSMCLKLRSFISLFPACRIVGV